MPCDANQYSTQDLSTLSTSEAGVNQAQDTLMLTVKVASDVKQKLQEWAARNLSSMTAELNRSIRERAEREQRQ
ncbi:hypothetical protein BJS_05957 [Bradyrhizobium japonicum SEMIA 5079]|nr:hypothetical protein BJS_05957 [Bradyrhizobium japonicum SEMIA 5079]